MIVTAPRTSGPLRRRSGRSFSGALQTDKTQASQMAETRIVRRLYDQGRLLPSGNGAQASVATSSQNAIAAAHIPKDEEWFRDEIRSGTSSRVCERAIPPLYCFAAARRRSWSTSDQFPGGAQAPSTRAASD